ncbi:hypothetical protein WDU94_006085 [Cyamophila willieti]
MNIKLLLKYFSSDSLQVVSTTPSFVHGYTLFDFTTSPHLDNWEEVSDTKRDVGKSKAVFTLHKSSNFQNAIFFTLLNPQSNGACFAGSRTDVKFDLSKYDMLVLFGHVHGNHNASYKIVLQHNGIQDNRVPCYEYIFHAQPSHEPLLFQLPLDEFKPIFRGRYVPGTPPLNKANITRLGIQTFGGVYEQTKQSGVSCLSIDWIKAVHSKYLDAVLNDAHMYSRG